MEESSCNAIARVKARKDVKAKAVGASATFATAIRGENATYDSICGGTFMPPSFTPSPLNVTAPNPADLNANPRHAGPYQVKPCAVNMTDTYVPWAYAHGRKPGASVFAMTGREGKY